VRYVEHAAFLIEQAAQEVEVSEEQAITFGAARRRRSATGPMTWRELGPHGIPGGEGYDGSRVDVSGRITALAVDPHWPDTIYAGAALGGVWRSDDRGRTWTPMSDREPLLAVGALALDTRQPGLLLVGLGESNVALRNLVRRGDRVVSGDRGNGIMRSVDGGRSWESIPSAELGDAAFASLARTSSGPITITLAATTRGVFRSRDNGASWAALDIAPQRDGTSLVATDVVVDPKRTGRAFVALWAQGIYRTEDVFAGTPKWTRLTDGLPLSNIGRVALAISSNSPSRVFALVANADSYLRGLYASDDGGDSWSRVSGTPDLLQGQGFFNVVVAVDPSDADVVYLAGAGRRGQHASSLYRATRSSGRWYFAPIGAELHIDFHAIAFDPRDARRVYVGNDGGVWRTDDGGFHWMNCNDGLAITQMMSLDQDPSGALVAGTQDNGTLVWRNGEWRHVDDGDGGNVRFYPSKPAHIYNEYKTYRLARSEAGGRVGTFVPVHPKFRNEPFTAFASPYDLDPSSVETIALGVDDLYVTTDGGGHWEKIGHEFTIADAGVNVSVISAVRYGGRGAIYVGTSHGAVSRVTRSGGRWQVDPLVDTRGFVTTIVTSLGFTPTVRESVFIGTTSAAPLWVCSVKGRAAPRCSSTSNLGGPVYSIAIDPQRHVAFVGTETGVYCASHPFVTWTRLGEQLPRVPVYQVLHHPALRVLRVGTYGRGVWELALGRQYLNACA
jgi:photosystem II stability/assembly factor-like uncharacterized protein